MPTIQQVNLELKRIIREIKTYPQEDWKRTEHFERYVRDINKGINYLQNVSNNTNFKRFVPFDFKSDHYSSTGKTINERGYESLLFYIEQIEDCFLNTNQNVDKKQSSPLNNNKIFIVHGRDELALLQTENIVSRLGLEPIVLKRMANQGLTLIEKFEKHSDVKYAIVLLTPDDVGALNEPTPHYQFRARQNVIFELGFFYGKLGRSNVCCLLKSGVERPVNPSDIDGISYIPYSNSVEEKELDIIKELNAVGFSIAIKY
ncbi:nucleotide-binding protein [Bacillus sp. SD075]|nr:nucleotide-binding protein [Bacillus sp. SD075]